MKNTIVLLGLMIISMNCICQITYYQIDVESLVRKRMIQDIRCLTATRNVRFDF